MFPKAVDIPLCTTFYENIDGFWLIPKRVAWSKVSWVPLLLDTFLSNIICPARRPFDRSPSTILEWIGSLKSYYITALSQNICTRHGVLVRSKQDNEIDTSLSSWHSTLGRVFHRRDIGQVTSEEELPSALFGSWITHILVPCQPIDTYHDLRANSVGTNRIRKDRKG